MIVILFACLIAYAAKPVSTSCPLEMTPAHVLVPFGGPVSAVCKSSSDQTKGMGWESPYGGTGLVKSVSNLSLQIDSLQSWRLRPICFVNLNGSQCTKELPVTVYQMPHNVSISLENHIGPFVEWELFVVLCAFAQIAPIQHVSLELFNGDKRLDNVLFADIAIDEPVSKVFRFPLLSKREYNGARFHCEAKIDLGPLGHLPVTSSEPLELIVLYAPALSQPKNETLTFPLGGQMSLNCSASGNPAPEYSWKTPDMARVLTGTQAIFNSSFKQPGSYECTAANSRGAVTKRFTVTQAPRSRPGTTAGILIAMFFVIMLVVGCGVALRQKLYRSAPSQSPNS